MNRYTNLVAGMALTLPCSLLANGGLVGLGVLSGQNSGQGGLIGVDVLNGDHLLGLQLANQSLLGIGDGLDRPDVLRDRLRGTALSAADFAGQTLPGLLGLPNLAGLPGLTGPAISLAPLAGLALGPGQTTSGNLLGAGLFTDQGRVNGNIVNVGALNSAGNANGGLAGLTALSGGASGNAGAVGAAIVSGDGSGNGGLLGASVLSGNLGGNGGLAGAAIASGDASGNGGLLGIAAIAGNGVGNGDLAGASILAGNASGNGGLIGTSVLGGDASGNGGLVGASVLSGNASGNGGLVGVSVLSGDASGNGGLVGASVLSGDAGGNGDLVGASVLSGTNSGNGGLLGVAALSGENSGNNGGMGLGALGGSAPDFSGMPGSGGIGGGFNGLPGPAQPGQQIFANLLGTGLLGLRPSALQVSGLLLGLEQTIRAAGLGLRPGVLTLGSVAGALVPGGLLGPETGIGNLIELSLAGSSDSAARLLALRLFDDRGTGNGDLIALSLFGAGNNANAELLGISLFGGSASGTGGLIGLSLGADSTPTAFPDLFAGQIALALLAGDNQIQDLGIGLPSLPDSGNGGQLNANLLSLTLLLQQLSALQSTGAEPGALGSSLQQGLLSIGLQLVPAVAQLADGSELLLPLLLAADSLPDGLQLIALTPAEPGQTGPAGLPTLNISLLVSESSPLMQSDGAASWLASQGQGLGEGLGENPGQGIIGGGAGSDNGTAGSLLPGPGSSTSDTLTKIVNAATANAAGLLVSPSGQAATSNTGATTRVTGPLPGITGGNGMPIAASDAAGSSSVVTPAGNSRGGDTLGGSANVGPADLATSPSGDADGRPAGNACVATDPETDQRKIRLLEPEEPRRCVEEDAQQPIRISAISR